MSGPSQSRKAGVVSREERVGGETGKQALVVYAHPFVLSIPTVGKKLSNSDKISMPKCENLWFLNLLYEMITKIDFYIFF